MGIVYSHCWNLIVAIAFCCYNNSFFGAISKFHQQEIFYHVSVHYYTCTFIQSTSPLYISVLSTLFHGLTPSTNTNTQDRYGNFPNSDLTSQKQQVVCAGACKRQSMVYHVCICISTFILHSHNHMQSTSPLYSSVPFTLFRGLTPGTNTNTQDRYGNFPNLDLTSRKRQVGCAGACKRQSTVQRGLCRSCSLQAPPSYGPSLHFPMAILEFTSMLRSS